ncbi:MAG: substrate-binding domain-containing protein [Desulfomonile tiedjei]|nr:substrate-binding domain-containing protein [Desulfomonile tiedjei]
MKAGLIALVLAFNGLTWIGVHANQGEATRDGTYEPIVRLMDRHRVDSSEASLGKRARDDGNHEAIRSLLDRQCEVAMTSRKMRREEIREADHRGMEIKETIVERVGIAVGVNPANPINELTVDQVRRVFTGKCKMWNEVGGRDEPILPVVMGKQSVDMMEYFAHTFLKTPAAQMSAEKKPLSELSNAVTLLRFEETGFEPPVKLLAIKKDERSVAILPSKETVNCGTYPFVQPLYLYIDWKKATDAARAFFNFYSSRVARPSCK